MILFTTNITRLPMNNERYAQGVELANKWVAYGCSLMANPPGSDEAFDNGFCDRLSQLAEKAKPSRHTNKRFRPESPKKQACSLDTIHYAGHVVVRLNICVNDWGITFECYTEAESYIAGASMQSHNNEGFRVEKLVRESDFETLWRVTVFADGAAAMGIDSPKGKSIAQNTNDQI
jgi:hypothetical protein